MTGFGRRTASAGASAGLAAASSGISLSPAGKRNAGATGRTVGFFDSIVLGFGNYFDFAGRSSRGAYWFWALFIFFLAMATTTADEAFFPYNEYTPVTTFTDLATLIPGIALTVRRLHDIGKSGWWMLMALTIIGIIPLIYMMCVPGNRSANSFGPDAEAGRG